MEKSWLPKLETLILDDLYGDSKSHYINKKDWRDISLENYKKYIILLNNCKKQVGKHFKKHKSFDAKIITTGLKILFEKKWNDSYVKMLDEFGDMFKKKYDENDSLFSFKSLEEVYDFIDAYTIDFIFFSNIQWWDKSKKNISSVFGETKKELLSYISWELMIDLIFEFSNQNWLPIILQRFSRDWNMIYDNYKKNIKKYGTSVDFSEVNIWNKKEFDMFDKNLVFGLNYLKTIDGK